MRPGTGRGANLPNAAVQLTEPCGCVARQTAIWCGEVSAADRLAVCPTFFNLEWRKLSRARKV